ncbi:methyltransferase domain-containing protein [Actinophytocola sp.]|uniref:methyltransferase domain-containing protein n=1 Tax=Actinophytocola sp. TaxID=1872138 RepID=UPI002D3CA008|nr:methyltransferase domain-containing protein [Actinophytocola sp.]HYQ62245.1 methyltransferase domain-containing protein [Actinophytocola sp.]
MSVFAGQYTAVDDTEDASWFISFSDSVNAIPEYHGVRQSLIEQLGSLAGRHVLDVGCGPGDDTRELASLAGPAGRVVGVDLSETMLAEARRRGGPVEFIQDDVYGLSFPNATFDRVRAKLVRMHLLDIDAADDELVRVLRPGGRLAVFDLDFETLALDHPDRAATRAFQPYWADHHKQGWCGRQMRRRFMGRGMTDVTITPHTMQMSYGLFRRAAEGAVAEAVAAGVLDSVEGFLRPLAEADEAGVFFASLTGYVLGATRSPAA